MNASFDYQLKQQINAERVQEDVDDSIIFVDGSFTNMLPLEMTPPTPLRRKSGDAEFTIQPPPTAPAPSGRQTPSSPPSPPSTAEAAEYVIPDPSCSPALSFVGAVTSTPQHPGADGIVEDAGVDDEEAIGGFYMREQMWFVEDQRKEFKNIHKEWMRSVRSSMVQKCRSLTQRHMERCTALNTKYRALHRYRRVITAGMTEILNQIRQSESVIRDLEDMSKGIPIPIPAGKIIN